MKLNRMMDISRLNAWLSAAIFAAVLFFSGVGWAANPYARSRDYHLENVKTHLRFDLDHRMVTGEVTHTLSVLRSGLSQIEFDSSGLKIESVTLNGKPAQFHLTEEKLQVELHAPSKTAEKYQVTIRYSGQPKKGLYFVLPDANNPKQPREVWTQGEDEDTHFYIPIYDYPNDRTSSEMILTVPAGWITVSNGRLAGVKAEPDGMKTWDWIQSDPIATYLISAVAGEFTEKKDTWRGIPVEYVVPVGMEDRIAPTFARTRQMLDLFSDKLGVRYPWVKYTQTSVDDFVVGGMENASATTLTTRGLLDPRIAAEDAQGSDGLISHEMAHQWFGDLVTCKDWANLWLNEGFATYYEHLWTESYYGKDAVDYEFWRDSNNWNGQKRLFPAPIVNYDSTDSLGFTGNIYTKGGWVLRMLRFKLGDAVFFHSMNQYLESHRLQNVMTSDLTKSIEQATATNVDQFFAEWVYGAGAPQFEVSYAFDEAAHQVNLTVKQAQKVEGRVGLFHVPVDVEIATPSGRKTSSIQVSQASEVFHLPADSKPLMVVFDAGGKVLKTAKFDKPWQEWVYQLKNGSSVPDRADAAKALGDIKDNDQVTAALGDAALNDAFWGVRREAIVALGHIATPDAEQKLINALANPQPWVRDQAVEQLGNFKQDASLPRRIMDIYGHDPAFRVRAAALNALGDLQTPSAYATLEAAAQSDSPDDTLRVAALRAFGPLGDDRAVPALLKWSMPGNPAGVRRAAISSLAKLDKKNKDVTMRLAGYLNDSESGIRFTAIFALGERGDPAAIEPMQQFLASGDLFGPMKPFIEAQIARLKGVAAGKPGEAGAPPQPGGETKSASNEDLMKSLQGLEQQMAAMQEQLKRIEAQMPGKRP